MELRIGKRNLIDQDVRGHGPGGRSTRDTGMGQSGG